METDESRRGKDPAALSGGHLCHVCGYQYPNPNPSAKLRRSHRKHCKALPAAAAAREAVAEVEEAVAGVGEPGDGGAGERNAAERTPLGGGGGAQREEIDASEANGGGAALGGSAGGVDCSVEGKVTAEHTSPPGTGAQVIATEPSKNDRLINCIDNGSACAEDGLVNYSSKSIENVHEGNGTESQIACTNGNQTKVEHPAEREDSFDEYQDASPFLHQPDSEDGAAPSSVFSAEINNLNYVPSGSSVDANETSVETNELCKVQFPGEPNMRDLSSDSNVGYNLEDGALRLAEPEVNLKLGGSYGYSLNVDNTSTDMVYSKPDKTSGHSEMIDHLNASSLQDTHPLILEPESESASSGKVEDRLHVSHTMFEASPRPEVVGSDIVQLETITNPSTNAMPIGSDLKVVCTDNAPIDCSTELPTQNWSVEDISDDQQPLENSCKKSLECSTAGFQHDLPGTNVDDIPITNVNDLEFAFEQRTQPDIVEENLSVQKANGFTQEEVLNKQIDPEIPTEDQFSMSQKHAALLDQASSVKNPFNLDDDKNDDLFELPTDNCFLKVPNSVELRQQVESTSLMIEQPTVSNLTRMAEVQQCHNSNEHILSTSSAIENSEVIGLEDMPVSSSSYLVSKTCLTDHGPQEDGHTSGVNFVPSQATSTEFSTVSMHDISVVSAQAKQNMQAKDASAKEMTAVQSIDGIVMEQATSPTVKDAYAANVEEKKPNEGSAAEVNEVQHSVHIEEKQAGGTELSSVQGMGILEENEQAEGTNAKEMSAQSSADDVKDETQTDGTSAGKTNALGGTEDSEEKMLAHDTTANEVTAEQSADHLEKKQQPNGIVGQEGSNTKQNEEIGAPSVRLNSGRVHVPLKVLLAEASAENQVKKPSTKERVLSFRRRVSKEGNSSMRSGSPKSGSDDHHWSSPAKLPRKDVDKSSKGRKQPWMPFICCHSVH
ncbi:unnamed protein product [Urochloa humidicola]